MEIIKKSFLFFLVAVSNNLLSNGHTAIAAVAVQAAPIAAKVAPTARIMANTAASAGILQSVQSKMQSVQASIKFFQETTIPQIKSIGKESLKYALPLSILGTAWYLNKLRDLKIADIQKLGKKYQKKNEWVDFDFIRSNNLNVIQDKFSFAKWRLNEGYTPYAIYLDIAPEPSDRENKENKEKYYKIMKALIDDIKDQAGLQNPVFVQAFVYDKKELIKPSTQEKDIVTPLLSNIADEMKAISADMENPKNKDKFKEIEKQLIKICNNISKEKKMGIEFKSRDHLWVIDDRSFERAIDELERSKIGRIGFLNNVLNFDKSEFYQKLCGFWYKEEGAFVDTYISMVKDYVRLYALHQLVGRYTSYKGYRQSSGGHHGSLLRSSILS